MPEGKVMKTILSLLIIIVLAIPFPVFGLDGQAAGAFADGFMKAYNDGAGTAGRRRL